MSTQTAKEAYQAIQTIVGAKPDGVPGPQTDSKLASLRATVIVNPDVEFNAKGNWLPQLS